MNNHWHGEKSPVTTKKPIIWGCRYWPYIERCMESESSHPCGGLFVAYFMGFIKIKQKKIIMKKQFTLLVLFFVLIFGSATLFFANAAGNELNTTINLQDVGSLPAVPEVPTINVLPNTTYTYTLSITNNILLGNDISRKVQIVYLRPRLPSSFALNGPVTCPTNWEELNQLNFGRGVGIINCIELGLDTTSPTTVSNPQYDLKYGQSANVSFTFTTPSSNGTTDLNLAVGSINSSGVLTGGFGYVAVHIVVESPFCTSYTYSDWSS